MEQAEAPTSRRRPRPYVVLLAAAVVLLVAWLVLAARATGQVQVTWAGQPDCTGATVDERGEILVAPGMRCVVRAVVTNAGSHDVRIAEVFAPFAGPGTGARLTATEIDGHRIVRGGIDASAEIGRTLPGHASRSVDLVLVLRPHPGLCNRAGSTAYFGGWPVVQVSAWGRSHNVRSDRQLSEKVSMKYAACRARP